MIQGAGPAQLDAYGESVSMSFAGTPPGYASELASLVVPFKTGASAFSVNGAESTLFTPSGKAPVTGAGWLLPVAVVAPDALGEASGNGALGVFLADGLAASWQGQPRRLPLGPTVIVTAPGQLVVKAEHAHGRGGAQRMTLGAGSAGAPSTLALQCPAKLGVLSVSETSGNEVLVLDASVTLSSTLPLTVQGQRVPVHAKTAMVTLGQTGSDVYFSAEGAVDPPRDGRKALAFSLVNGVLISTPAESLVVMGTYQAGALSDGGALLGFGLKSLLPILPDPYCANVALIPPKAATGAKVSSTAGTAPPTVLSVSVWTANKAEVVDFVLPSGAVPLPPPSPPTVLPLPQASAPVQKILADDRRREQALSNVFDHTLGSPPGGLMLLDLSSNVDQFGVRFSGAGSAGWSALAIEQLQLVLPAQEVRVVTLPAVLWEPVVTVSDPNDPNFPSPMSFANSGGPTALAAETVELVAVAPQPALEQLVGGFNDASNPRSVAASLTLPFGIKAFAQIAPTDPDGYQAALDFNRPQFPARSLAGGFQVRIDALASPGIVPGGTPSLKGATLQMRNGLLSGVATGKSVLGSADLTFNSYFDPNATPPATNPRVPLTRIDISGYGESLFSDWRNPDDGAGIVTKATFDVLVGRTSYELVQIQSIVYPYAVRVVRSIVLQRLNTGTVIRRDSGWKAVSEGRYAYPEPDFRTHPGVVLGVRNVVNIRETGQTYTTAAHTIMMAVRFDCDVDIAGAELGASATGVPARNQLGFVQMTAVVGRKAITPAELKEILDKFGPLCGPVDCRIDIGGSGQKMRVARVGAAAADGGTSAGPDFAIGAWGSPVLPRGGQWSFTRRRGTANAPEPIDRNLGVPLIRPGLAPSPPVNAPYRFADPADVNKPATPQTEYGLLHATGTQRLLFRRPTIEAGSQAITSKPPTAGDPVILALLADPYAMATSHGVFPALPTCIPVPDPNWALQIDTSGNLKLVIAQSSFSVAFGQREIVKSGGIHSYVQYRDEHGSVSTATIALDTSAAVPWRIQLSQVSFATASGKLGEVIRVVADIDASAAGPTQFKNSRILLGGAFKPVQQILEFLDSLNIPIPLHARMTNAWKLQEGIKLHWDDVDLGVIGFHDVELSLSITCQTDQGVDLSEIELAIGATVFIVIPPFAPFQGVGVLEFAVALSADDETIAVTWGGGIGIEKVFGIGKFTGYAAQTYFVISTGTALGVGAGAILSLSIEIFHLAEISVEAEVKIAIVSVTCLPKDAIYGVIHASIHVDVTTKFLMDVSWEYDWSDEQQLGGGPCALPDIV